MRVIAKSTLREFWEKCPKSKQQLLAWHKHFSKAEYRNANEIRKVFSSADNVGNGRIVFNICRNDYRLIIQFNYKFQFAFVRFIGTHKEYDNIKDIKNI
jgi:mRNA interferase HigB